MNREILIKYLKNRCSGEEFEELVTWITGNGQNQDGRTWSFDHWKHFEPEIKNEEKIKYSALLDKIHHEINLRQREKKGRPVIVTTEVVKWFSRAAAVLFLPLLGVVFYLLSNGRFQTDQSAELLVENLEIIAPVGSRTVVQLTDGTEVNLNYGSTLKYPRSFTGERREIILSGEAYFNVAHYPEKPFIVKTGKLDIQAVGTAFNVQAYPGDDVVATTLVEGKVVIGKPTSGNKTEPVETMVPGQHVEYNTVSGKMCSVRGSIEKYIAWKEGRLVFDNEPIAGVAEKLSRMFNVDIEVADDVRYLSYTVTFVNDPLYLILDLMTETTPVKYHALPRKRQPDGTFSKQKIRIVKRT